MRFRLFAAIFRAQVRWLAWMMSVMIEAIRDTIALFSGATRTKPEPTATTILPRRGREQFAARSYSNAAGLRSYKLFIPSKRSRGPPRTLVVMLHGCTQDPDDFAAGTRMNELAERDGFLVVYPAQSVRANAMRCWNWFDPNNQTRDRGESSLIAGIAREVATEFRIDSRRIFVAGLSAGGAMAVIMGDTYPDVFAAVGVHSGVPYWGAKDLQTAFASISGIASNQALSDEPRSQTHFVPTIVFHGDRDATVRIENGVKIVDHAVALSARLPNPLSKNVGELASANGREFTMTSFSDSADKRIVEYWVVHGAGHAWSGGSPKGSYTDERGPDASEEMIRFFMQPR